MRRRIVFFLFVPQKKKKTDQVRIELVLIMWQQPMPYRPPVVIQKKSSSIFPVLLLLFIGLCVIGFIIYFVFFATQEEQKPVEKTDNWETEPSHNNQNNPNNNNNNNNNTNSTNDDKKDEEEDWKKAFGDKFKESPGVKLTSNGSKTKEFKDFKRALEHCVQEKTCAGVSFAKDASLTLPEEYTIAMYSQVKQVDDSKMTTFRKIEPEDASSIFDTFQDQTWQTVGKGSHEHNYESLKEAMRACADDELCLGLTQESESDKKAFLLHSYVTSSTQKEGEKKVWASGKKDLRGSVTYLKKSKERLGVENKFEDKGVDLVIENTGGTKNFTGIYDTIEEAQRACLSNDPTCWGFVQNVKDTKQFVFSVVSTDGKIAKKEANDKNWKFFKRTDIKMPDDYPME